MRDCSSRNEHLIKRRQKLTYRCDWIVAILDEIESELTARLSDETLSSLELKGITEVELLEFVNQIGQIVLDTGLEPADQAASEQRQVALLDQRRALLNLLTETRREIRFINKILDERAAQAIA